MVILVFRSNRLDTTDILIFMRRPIFWMSHGLTNPALALPPFTAAAEVRHPVGVMRLTDFDGDFFLMLLKLNRLLLIYLMTIFCTENYFTHIVINYRSYSGNTAQLV